MDLGQKVNFGILIVVILIGIFGYFAYTGKFNEFYVTPFVKKAGFISQLDPNFPSELNLLVYFESNSISAQNPITVKAKAFPSEFFYRYSPDPWNAYGDKMYLLFPDALKHPLHQYAEGDFEGAVIELKRNDQPREFVGSGQIVFIEGGKFGYYLVRQSFMDKHLIDEKTTQFSLKEFENKISSLTRTSIADSSVTAEMRTNNLILALTLLAFAVSIVQSRNHISNGIMWLNTSIDNKRFLLGIVIFSILFFSVIGLTLYLDERIVRENDEYGFKYVNKKYDYEIKRSDTNWFFIRNVAERAKALGLPLLTLESLEDSTLIQKFSGESVFVGVYDEPNYDVSDSKIGEVLSNMFEYYGMTEFVYSIKDKNGQKIVQGHHEDSNREIRIEFIPHNSKLYVKQSFKYLNSSQVTSDELDQISNSFNFCSQSIVGCLKEDPPRF